jgi:hypothetical protein
MIDARLQEKKLLRRGITGRKAINPETDPGSSSCEDIPFRDDNLFHDIQRYYRMMMLMISFQVIKCRPVLNASICRIFPQNTAGTLVVSNNY